jgi:hypothetical protein
MVQQMDPISFRVENYPNINAKRNEVSSDICFVEINAK